MLYTYAHSAQRFQRWRTNRNHKWFSLFAAKRQPHTHTLNAETVCEHEHDTTFSTLSNFLSFLFHDLQQSTAAAWNSVVWKMHRSLNYGHPKKSLPMKKINCIRFDSIVCSARITDRKSFFFRIHCWCAMCWRLNDMSERIWCQNHMRDFLFSCTMYKYRCTTVQLYTCVLYTNAIFFSAPNTMCTRQLLTIEENQSFYRLSFHRRLH